MTTKSTSDPGGSAHYEPEILAKLQHAAEEIIELLSGSRDDRRQKAVNKIMSFRGQGSITRYTLVRVLISTGQNNNDYDLTACAIEAFENIKSKAPTDDPMLYYDIANGYQVLFELKVIGEKANIFGFEVPIREALKYFAKASSHPRTLTNHGNLYDSIGRPIEAIRLYEAALAVDATFGMAIGNKAMAVEHLSPIVRYPKVYQIYAYQLYEEALMHADSVEAEGGPTALNDFLGRHTQLRNSWRIQSVIAPQDSASISS